MNQTELFALPPLEAAEQLLGWEFVHITSEGPAGGIITEVEAYLQEDPASHTFRGLTQRNAPMFKEAGHIYTYLSYGLHICMNIVLGPAEYGAAALIRALTPTVGIELMQRRRGATIPFQRLCSGPGNVGQALGLTRADSGKNIVGSSEFSLKPPPHPITFSITKGPRIGISQGTDLPYRFIVSQPVDTPKTGA